MLGPSFMSFIDQASLSKLGCSTSLPGIFLRLSSRKAPAISYGCEVWGSQCHGNLVSNAKKLQGLQLAFLRIVCGRMPVGIPAAVAAV